MTLDDLAHQSVHHVLEDLEGLDESFCFVEFVLVLLAYLIRNLILFVVVDYLR